MHYAHKDMIWLKYVSLQVQSDLTCPKNTHTVPLNSKSE